jgi:hypothetical protein
VMPILKRFRQSSLERTGNRRLDPCLDVSSLRRMFAAPVGQLLGLYIVEPCCRLSHASLAYVQRSVGTYGTLTAGRNDVLLDGSDGSTCSFSSLKFPARTAPSD